MANAVTDMPLGNISTMQEGTVVSNTEYSYPTSAYAVEFYFGPNKAKKQLIFYNGAPASLFDTTPNGSALIRGDASNGSLYVKAGTDGLANGTWGTQIII